MHDHTQEHVRVLKPAERRAVSEVCAGGKRLDPRLVRAVGDQIGFSRQLRNPEAVDDIRRLERKGGRMAALDCARAHRDMDLVGRDDSLLRVANLPPPLVADEPYLDGVFRHRGILDFSDRAARHENENERDQDRNDRPCELDMRAAVNLRRLLKLVVLPAVPEFPHDIDEHRRDHHKDSRRDQNHKHRRLVDHFGRPRQRIEHVRNRPHRPAILRAMGRAHESNQEGRPKGCGSEWR